MNDREMGRRGGGLPAPTTTGGGLPRTHAAAVIIVLLVGFMSVTWQILILSGGDALPISTRIAMTASAVGRVRRNFLGNTSEIHGPAGSVDLARNGSLWPWSHVQARVEARARKGNVVDNQEDEANCKPKDMDPWPFERQDAGGSAKWPNAGWKRMELCDSDFQTSFKFYLYEDEPFRMDDAYRCFMAQWNVPFMNSTDYKIYDDKLRLVQRLYIPELAVWPVLQQHPMRTKNPDEAHLFVIGWSPVIAWNLQKRGQAIASRPKECAGLPNQDVWESEIEDFLQENKHYQAKAGRDHMMFWVKYGTGVGPKLRALLDGGVLLATTDRYFWSIFHNLPTPFRKGSVIIVPYVVSSYVDVEFNETRVDGRNRSGWYYFRGNYNRRQGGRTHLAQVATHLTGANFANTRFGGPDAELLRRSADEMRSSAVCPSPQGDAPTSGRMFEALATGCVPVVSSPLQMMKTDLPFPSLIDWDQVALHTEKLPLIQKTSDGLERLGKALDDTFGPNSPPKNKERLDCMSREGVRVFQEHMSYFGNPRGVTDSILLEAWVHLQKTGLIAGPHAPGGITQLPKMYERWATGKGRDDQGQESGSLRRGRGRGSRDGGAPSKRLMRR